MTRHLRFWLLVERARRARTDAAIDEAIAVTWDKPVRPAGPRLAKRIDVLTCDCIWMWEAATGWQQTYECGLHEDLKEITR